MWSNYTIVEKDIHILAGVVEDALHSRAQEIGKIIRIPQVSTYPYPAQFTFLKKVMLHAYYCKSCSPATLHDLALVFISVKLG